MLVNIRLFTAIIPLVLTGCGGKIVGDEQPIGSTGGNASSGQGGAGHAGVGQAGTGQAGSGTAGSGHAGSGQAGSGHAGVGQGGSTHQDFCREVEEEIWAARRCERRRDCGQPIPGTSCGCTRDWVANREANVDELAGLIRDAAESGCDLPLGSNCDCPPAEGFACIDSQCTWNYVESETLCSILPGSGWETFEPLECGEGPNGQVFLCHWAIKFERDIYSWAWSDIMESGEYTCEFGEISTPRQGNRPGPRGQILSGEELEWDGMMYRRR